MIGRMHDNATLGETRVIPAEEWGPGYELWNSILNWLGQRGPDGTTSLVRVASHLVIVAVAVLVLWISRVQLPEWDILQAPGSTQTAVEVAPRAISPDSAEAGANNLVRAPVPFTLVPERAQAGMRQHTVSAGDTLYDIAAKYHISADTLVWANGLEENPDLLRLGQELVIPPVDGVLYTVAQGDTLESIAKKLSAKVANMTGFEWNQLDPQNPKITVGQKVMVVGGVRPQPAAAPGVAPVPVLQTARAPGNAPRGGGRFVWPSTGYVTQGFGRYHAAIDLASYIGNPVKAADAGYVAESGWSNVGYGYHIVIDHGNGYQTLYAHLSKMLVKAGQTVTQGQLVGAVGSTGNSTGPHLHFEVRLNGMAQNPFNFLP
jgi:murein DD-endopeptidase MepM/ murein hydrolase activator NlpD